MKLIRRSIKALILKNLNYKIIFSAFTTNGLSTDWRPIPKIIGLKVTVRAASDAQVILATSSITDGDTIDIIFNTFLDKSTFIRENGVICSDVAYYCPSNDTNIINDFMETTFIITWPYISWPAIFVEYVDRRQVMVYRRSKYFNFEYFGVKTS